MNRYAALGMTLDALEGNNIMVLTRTREDKAGVIDELEAFAPEGTRIARVRDGERITYPNGKHIVIRSHRQGVRGHSPNVCYLDEGVDPEMTPDQYTEVMACLLTTGGEIIRA